ncbi:glycine zipper 2TM domain-containing protein [Polaromonas sp. JS666]|uniref:glycine zipper 2TM domain-containing protein n=1 Tax=Polaromonas sp. (strain JS666 / ATCC BAA-500) TaxID=296591 RepID=UPI0000532382|nr:glycine zipper 2TM domain-containing protein [Polaromonas sp. JS666]ABE45091.1 17 kDa surface antigen [Polaromonas sp. JS666]
MRQPSRYISTTASVLLLAALAACGSPPMSSSEPVSTYPSSSYPAQYPQGNYTEFGRVTNVEVLRTSEPGKGSGVGAVLGGVAGAVVGSQIGGGSGRTAATVVGAVGGAVAGNAIEKSRSTTVRETYRISIRLDNGGTRAYDVPAYGDLRVGDRVRIENGQIYRL